MITSDKTVIINANCKGGKGLSRWGKIVPLLQDKYGSFSVYLTHNKNESEKLVHKLIRQGKRIFISAGGDGCVNSLINAIIDNKKNIPLAKFTIGAVGLGSSNDYHKPAAEKIEKIPIRLNAQNAGLRDVGEIIFSNGNGKTKKSYFLISASTGIVAEGNKNFNIKCPILNFLKKRNTDLAILWTFFKTLLHFINVPLSISADNQPIGSFNTSYLAVSKTPYISGMFHFDAAIARNDGRFMVKILHNCFKSVLIKILIKLSCGKEKGIQNLQTHFCRKLDIYSPDSFTLEFDGETVSARKVTFQIYKERIKECM